MRGLILLTAMPPTRGHSFLVNWASKYLDSFSNDHINTLYVLVCTQPGEPLCEERYYSVKSHFSNLNNVRVGFLHTKMPQYPKSETDQDFWDAWKSEILKKVNPTVSLNGNIVDFVFSSESYGYKLAETLGAEHIIVDPGRQFIKTTATYIRHNPYDGYEDIIPEFRKYVQKTVTFFGAESVGKTFMASDMSYDEDSRTELGYIPEYARPYLESLKTPEVTDDRMLRIVKGQYTSEQMGKNLLGPIVYRDTDLLSTIGYYRLYDHDYKNNSGYNLAVALFKQSKADMYFLLSTEGVPFKPDPLRYGGNKRESDDQYWINLLEEFECPYKIIKGSSIERHIEVNCVNYELYANQPIFRFIRDKGE